MVAALVAVGVGRLTPEHIPRLLEAKDPGLSPGLAPPHGLFLRRVHYQPESLVYEGLQRAASHYRELSPPVLDEGNESST